MPTGRRAFHGDDVSEVLEVLKSEPISVLCRAACMPDSMSCWARDRTSELKQISDRELIIFPETWLPTRYRKDGFRVGFQETNEYSRDDLTRHRSEMLCPPQFLRFKQYV